MEKTSDIKGSQRVLAKLMGVSQPAVSKMFKKGVVQVEPDGKILLEQAVKDWQAHVQMEKQRPFTYQGKEPRSDSIKEQVELYRRARARREIAEAALAELNLQKAEGKLIDAEATKKAFTDVAVATRDRLLALPQRVAPSLVGLGDETQVTNILNNEVQLALSGLNRVAI